MFVSTQITTWLITNILICFAWTDFLDLRILRRCLQYYLLLNSGDTDMTFFATLTINLFRFLLCWIKVSPFIYNQSQNSTQKLIILIWHRDQMVHVLCYQQSTICLSWRLKSPSLPLDCGSVLGPILMMWRTTRWKLFRVKVVRTKRSIVLFGCLPGES